MRFISLLVFSFLVHLILPFCARSSKPVAWVNRVPISQEELTRRLPQQIEPGKETTLVRECLEELINQELLVQEAERLGLDSCIAYPLELQKKGLVIYELFAWVAEKSQPVTEQELKNAYQLLGEEVRCRVLSVREETTAQRLYQELTQGAVFETLALRYSIHPSQRMGGDLGYIPEYYIEEPLRSAIIALKPGEWTKPVFFDSSYQIVLLLDRRPTTPPLPPFLEAKQQLKEQIKLFRRRQAAQGYVQKLRARLVYNPAGLAVFHKPADSVTPAEKEIWVAVRDNKKYVKVGRLLDIARRFPPGLDTTIRTYAIKRAIEDDLMFEDGLNLGLDKAPRVQEQLNQLRRLLLYDTLLNRLVYSKIVVTDSEVMNYYQTHQERYPEKNFSAVAPLIRNTIITERKKAGVDELLAQLRSQAKITINQKVMKSLVAKLSSKKEQK